MKTKIEIKDILREAEKITAKAYDDILNRPPHEVASISHIINELEVKGVELTEINIPYDKVKL